MPVISGTNDFEGGRVVSFTYAIADLHGRFDLLTRAYDAIAAHAAAPGTIIHLGDYVDRGPQSRQIIEFLMDPATAPAGWHRHVLKGNHEDMAVQCLRGHARMSWWLGNGGNMTLISYGLRVGDGANPKAVPEHHVEWLHTLNLYHEDEYRFFVHAGVDPEVSREEQTEEDLLWKLYPNSDFRGFDGKHVVHGHHPFANGPTKFLARTNLDTFAWNTGRLVVGVFDDEKPGGPVDLLEIIGEPA